MTNTVEARDEYVTLNGLRFHYRDWGAKDAPLLLVLHGLNSHSWDWDFLCEAVAGSYHVVALDQRGHGESDWAEDYSWPRFAQDIGALVEHFGVEQVTIFAYSIPAGFAVLYAASNPQRVRRLVIVDNTPTRRATATAARRDVAQATAEPGTVQSFGDPSEVVAISQRIHPNSNGEAIRRTVLHNVRQRDDGRWVRRDDQRAQGQVFAKTIPPEEHWLELSRIACPTLVVHAEYSAIHSDEAMARMAATIPDCELVRLKDSGHRVQWDNPSGLLELVLPFLLK